MSTLYLNNPLDVKKKFSDILSRNLVRNRTSNILNTISIGTYASVKLCA